VRTRRQENYAECSILRAMSRYKLPNAASMDTTHATTVNSTYSTTMDTPYPASVDSPHATTVDSQQNRRIGLELVPGYLYQIA
jgi:hypothetical protein